MISFKRILGASLLVASATFSMNADLLKFNGEQMFLDGLYVGNAHFAPKGAKIYYNDQTGEWLLLAQDGTRLANDEEIQAIELFVINNGIVLPVALNQTHEKIEFVGGREEVPYAPRHTVKKCRAAQAIHTAKAHMVNIYENWKKRGTK